MYIIGSHHGRIDDGYTTCTGGNRVQRIFQKRPKTMSRTILEYNTIQDNIEYTRCLEQKWLNKVTDIEFKKKYYNQQKVACGFSSEIARKGGLTSAKNGTSGRPQKIFQFIQIRDQIEIVNIKCQGFKHATNQGLPVNLLTRIQNNGGVLKIQKSLHSNAKHTLSLKKGDIVKLINLGKYKK